MQWGRGALEVNTVTTMQFPTSFNQCFEVTATILDLGTNVFKISLINFTPTYFTGRTTFSARTGISWISVGT